MPIYAYKCSSCGHQADVLQKIADAPLTQCPSCGQGALARQLTAPGFQLKGSGWYQTDFKGGPAAPAAKTETPKTDAPKEAAPAAPAAHACGAGGCGACG